MHTRTSTASVNNAIRIVDTIRYNIRIRSRSDNSNLLRRLQGKYTVCILQQDNSFFCFFQSQSVGIRIKQWNVLTQLRTVKESHLDARTIYSSDLFINQFFRNCTVLYQWQKFFTDKPVVTSHFQIQTILGCLVCRISTSPVRHQHSLESPFFFQDVNHETVLCTIGSLERIVSGHHCFNICTLHSCLERRKINFAQGTFIHFRADGITVELLIISDIMFDRRNDSPSLNGLYKRNQHFRRQIRIFTEILKVSCSF